jgi:anti-sigma regulatory factor (Ser/Thr protein kinase)
MLGDGTSLPTSAVERLATVLVERMGFPGEGFGDDVTVLLAQRRAAAPDFGFAAEATIAAVSASRRALAGWLGALGAGEVDIEALEYAVSEAVANVVCHAYSEAPGTHPAFSVRGHLNSAGVAHITVRDAGRWRAPPPGRSTGGRGILMMRKLTDRVDIEPGPTGTTVRVARALQRPVVITTPTRAAAPHQARADALTVDVDDNGEVATVAGPIDLGTVGELRAVLLHAARGGTRPLRLDLAGVSLLSSAGVQLLHDLTAIVPDLVIEADASGAAHAILRLTGLGDRLRPADVRAAAGEPTADIRS